MATQNPFADDQLKEKCGDKDALLDLTNPRSTIFRPFSHKTARAVLRR
jgi:hypothetical protein